MQDPVCYDISPFLLEKIFGWLTHTCLLPTSGNFELTMFYPQIGAEINPFIHEFHIPILPPWILHILEALELLRFPHFPNI